MYTKQGRTGHTGIWAMPGGLGPLGDMCLCYRKKIFSGFYLVFFSPTILSIFSDKHVQKM